jgi:hypothetical protein
MADEKFGVENLQKLLSFGVQVGKQLSDDLSDGKVSFTEVLALIPSFTALPDFIAKKDAIIAEAKDLSLDEVKQLAASVDGQFANEEVVAIIEDALNFIVSAKNLVERFTAKKA